MSERPEDLVDTAVPPADPAPRDTAVPPTDPTAAPVVDSSDPVALEPLLRRRLAALDLERKVRLLTGLDSWSLCGEPTVGLRPVVTSDGPVGVRGRAWDERDTSATIPSPTALAASWDIARIERLGRLLAAEARRKGVSVLLAPTVNLHRSPYGGRHFECFSEDPWWSGRVGAACVRGVQARGVAATAKHFVANDSETERFRLDARLDERTLRELYLVPFEVMVREGGVWAVMAAYTALNGTTMTEHPALREVLADGWGFDGVVMSDWLAARTTEPTARAGLDLVMPGPGGPWGAALVEAVREGRVPEELVDEKVLRLLRLAARVGRLDGVAPSGGPRGVDGPVGGPSPAGTRSVALSGAPSGALSETPPGALPAEPGPGDEGYDAWVAREVREAAAAGFVLARNDGVLPLEAPALRRVAVLGPNAVDARVLGGGSATVHPAYTVSPLGGLRAALGDGVEVLHAPGALLPPTLPVASREQLVDPLTGEPGLRAVFLGEGADGPLGELYAEHRDTGNLTWQGAVTEGLHLGAVGAVELLYRVRATVAGDHWLGCSGMGRFRLVAGHRVLVDEVLAPPEGMDFVDVFVNPPRAGDVVTLAEGEEVELRLSHRLEPGADHVAVKVLLAPPLPDPDVAMERAVAVAASADVAVVVVGTTEEVESEGFDRGSLALPGRQDELVRRVAAVNPHTVVVVNSGAPVLMPWVDEVSAVLLAWFPGQEFGNALADVLLGEREPGGRLPCTWPVDEDAPLPGVRPVEGVLEYTEGLHVGYRRFLREGVEPLFWFGHGLGYTTWEYGDVGCPIPRVAAGEDVVLHVAVRNVGSRPGREVVQVYASRPGSAVERPVRWFVTHAAVEAGAGEEVGVELRVPAGTLAHWDVASGAWTVEPGVVHLAVARCAGDEGRGVAVELCGGGEALPSGHGG